MALAVVDRLGLHPDPHVAVGLEGLHGDALQALVGHGRLRVVDGQVARGDLPHDAALEVDAEVEPTDAERHHAER